MDADAAVGDVTPGRVAAWQRLGIVPTRRAEHLAVSVQDGVVRRGERVVLTAAVDGSARERRREVGLVCVEAYKTIGVRRSGVVFGRQVGGRASPSRRSTARILSVALVDLGNPLLRLEPVVCPCLVSLCSRFSWE